MFANVVFVKVNDMEASEQELRDRVIPMVKEFPGFRRGTWLTDREAGRGLGFVVFETREDAESAAANVPPGGPDEPVTRERIETYEVIAEA